MMLSKVSKNIPFKFTIFKELCPEARVSAGTGNRDKELIILICKII